MFASCEVEPSRRSFQQAQAIVGLAVDVNDLRVLFQQFDSRQKARALQTFFVEIVGRHVRRCDQRHPAIEQATEQSAEQHRIGDVGHEELVEADDAGFLRDLCGDQLQRVGLVLMFLQLVVHRLHEAMEVAALAVFERQAD